MRRMAGLRASAMMVAERGCMNVIAHDKRKYSEPSREHLDGSTCASQPGVECGSGLDAGFPLDENVWMSHVPVRLGPSRGQPRSLTADHAAKR